MGWGGGEGCGIRDGDRGAGEGGERTRAAGGRGTSLGGRRRNNGAFPAPSPGRAGRAAAGARAQWAGTARAPPGSRGPACGGDPAALTLSDHGFEADGGHRAARVFGLRASSRDARAHRRLPRSARTAGCSPPPLSRSGDRLTRGLRAGAPHRPERGCRPAGVSARGRGRGRAGAGPLASRDVTARLRQSHCGPRARPRPPRCSGAGGLGPEGEPRPPPHITRRAPPAAARSRSARS